MPELCRFYGIVIRMYFNDHAPAHFHAEYSGDEAVFSIEAPAVLGGHLPPRAQSLVVEWECYAGLSYGRRGGGHNAWNRLVRSIHWSNIGNQQIRRMQVVGLGVICKE